MSNKTIKSLYISYNAMTEPIVQSQVIPYLRGLSKRGIKFYLLTFEKKKIRKEEKQKILAILKNRFNEGLSLEWLSLLYHKSPNIPAKLFDALAGFFYVSYIIVKNKIDIVHSRAIAAALIGYPAAKLLSKKFIFDTRGIDSEEYVDAGLWKRHGFKHRMVGFLERVVTKSSDYAIVLTERFHKILKEKYQGKETKFSVIPCAVDTDIFRVSNIKDAELFNRFKLQNKFVIAYIGSLGTWYMLKEMLDFFKVASRFVKNAHFLVLTQTDKDYALSLIRQNGLEEKQFTLDVASYDLMPRYLSLCNTGMFFIKPVFSKLSSSPVKFGEYLASGLPVIINRGIGDTEELVRKNRVGSIIEDFNESSYAKTLKEHVELLKDKDLANRCRLTAEKHLSLRDAVDKYYVIYRSLM